MFKKFSLVIAIIMVFSIFLMGCSENILKNTKAEKVEYTTLYQGFVMWMDGVQTMPPLGTLVFESEKEWQEFADNYIPMLYSMTTMFDYTHFDKEDLVYICSISSQTRYDSSSKLESLVIQNETLIPNFKEHNDDEIDALNNISRIKHPFIQIVKVNKDDISKNIKNKYRRGDYFNKYKKPNNSEIESVDINSLISDDLLINEMMKIKEEFKWIEDIKWDEVIITKDSEQYILKDKKIIQEFLDTFCIKTEVSEPNSGFISTVPKYSYTFKSNDKIFSITIMDRDVIRIDNSALDSFGKYFEAENIHSLGDAFIKEDIWRKVDNIESKIASCGVIVNKDDAFLPVFREFRKQFVARTLSNEAEKIEKPSKLSEKIEASYIVYYHGDKIIINVYKNFVNIIDGINEYWYSLEKADFKIYHILHGMC